MTDPNPPRTTVRVAIAAVVENVSTHTRHADTQNSTPPNEHAGGQGWRILITLRSDDQVLGGHWELPGGKLEPDESPRDAVVRELREEVGIFRERVTDLELRRYYEMA